MVSSVHGLRLVNGSARWSDRDQAIVAMLRDPKDARTVTCVITVEALLAMLEEGLDANDYIGAAFRFRHRIAALASEKLAAGRIDEAARVTIVHSDVRTDAKAALEALRRLLVRTSPFLVNPQALAELRGFHDKLAVAATGNETAQAKLALIAQCAETMWSSSAARRHTAGPETRRNNAIRALDTLREILC
jgi:hypothetical protein